MMAAAAAAGAGMVEIGRGLKWGLGLCIPHTGCCCMNMGAGSMVPFFNAVFKF
jgi:hypothetical protein